MSVSDGEEEEGKGERQQGSSAGTGDNTPRFTKEELANQLQQMFDDDSDGDVPKRSAQKPPPAAGAAAKKPAVAPAAVPAADRKPKVSPARRAAPAPKATPPSATRRPPAPTKTPPAPRPPPPARSSPEKGSAAAAPVPRREASPQKKGPAVRPSSAPTNRYAPPETATDYDCESARNSRCGHGMRDVLTAKHLCASRGWQARDIVGKHVTLLAGTCAHPVVGRVR